MPTSSTASVTLAIFLLLLFFGPSPYAYILYYILYKEKYRANRANRANRRQPSIYTASRLPGFCPVFLELGKKLGKKVQKAYRKLT